MTAPTGTPAENCAASARWLARPPSPRIPGAPPASWSHRSARISPHRRRTAGDPLWEEHAAAPRSGDSRSGAAGGLRPGFRSSNTGDPNLPTPELRHVILCPRRHCQPAQDREGFTGVPTGRMLPVFAPSTLPGPVVYIRTLTIAHACSVSAHPTTGWRWTSSCCQYAAARAAGS